MKMIVVNQDLCNGCQLCMIGCSTLKENRAGFRLSRIKVYQTIQGGNLAVTCNQCAEPVCRTACLMETISKSKEGIIQRNESACIGCEACVVTCPFGAVTFDPERSVAVSCDLCSGNPYCVDICPTGALQFIAPQDESLNKRQAAAQRMAAAGETKEH
jgi:Fe-S-cluster-containing hydrogenase component 2